MQWIITWNRPAFDSIIGFDSFESPFFSLFHKHKSTFTHISFSANKVWFLSRKNSSSNVCATFESNHKHTRTPPLRSYSEIHAELHAFRLTKFDFHMKYSSNPTYLAMDKLRYMWNAAHGTIGLEIKSWIYDLRLNALNSYGNKWSQVWFIYMCSLRSGAVIANMCDDFERDVKIMFI